MIFTPEATRSSAADCAADAGTASTPTMMFLSRTAVRQLAVLADHDVADRVADLRRILVEDGGDVDAVLREDRRARDRLAEPARADERDVVLPLRAQDLADLAEQRVDVVADAALAELAERRQIAPDLSRVDVRVLRDLLRGDALLSHLSRLRQHLEVPGQTSRDTDRQAVRHTSSLRRACNSARPF